MVSDGSTHGLMTTAIVHVIDKNEQPVECRVLLDTCSNANFITEELIQKLKIQTREQTVTIEALNELNTTTNRLVTLKIASKINNFSRKLDFFVIPRIAGQLPDVQIDRSRINIPSNIKLADPNFHQPAKIHMLIGTGPTLSCLSVGQINASPCGNSDLILQKTQFGWIIGGSAPINSPKRSRKSFITNVNFELSKFWEIEEGPQHAHLTPEEKECEIHFKQNITRNKTGRYIVALPFNENKVNLGESRTRALNRFLSLERKLAHNTDLRTEYHKVINEYIALGHLSPVEAPDDSEGFYLPHHAVVKLTSLTTKVRVVFDGSAKSSTGYSLNDALLTGPTIQDDIFNLLIRFRMHRFVLTGDIEKMYRQFLVRNEDRKFQKILWRNANNEIATYELNTITFGLTSAPYLATRCLQQLAKDESQYHNTASEIIKRDIYVDDLLTGADTLKEAQALRQQITDLLKRGGLNIRQWVSNDPHILSDLSKDQVHPKFFGDESVKTLGISWNPHNDNINYAVNISDSNTHTKRTMLSMIAKIFDPLGLLGPVIVTAKILMQRLWQLKVDWDESLPMNIQHEWCSYQKDLKSLEGIAFKRHVAQGSTKTIELHGFCDASEQAYGACFYIRTVDKSGRVKTSLLCAKSRVAPLKTISLARLELCGAHLLATLYRTITKSLKQTHIRPVFWTDSTIVFHWLLRSPNTLKTFVANRVADIQNKTEIAAWRHVRSGDNPADLLSRGITARELINSKFWQFGPNWLIQDESTWPKSCVEAPDTVPELRKINCFISTVNHADEIFERCSCIRRLRRVIAYCLRFSPNRRCHGPITASELNHANNTIIKLTQESAFREELHDIKNGNALSSKSKLLCLTPFVDEKGILRVGGRLQKSNLDYNQKHPILLPKNSHVTELIIRDAHIANLHSGLTSTLNTVRQSYWPIDGKNTTRKIIRKCIKCFRANPPTTNYIMGNLPAPRVTESRPFLNTGIDYCGPFYIKERRYRNRARVKIYVAVFICFSSKAIHLEVVGDMTTQAFMAALKRFIARRGLCKNIYSDNGTNFVGANNELTELFRVLPEDEANKRFLMEKAITWHFTPALSPHFGGLWEAAVRSFKHHLKRVVGEELFTHEQFSTFVTEIEAILNSRPLTPLSSDPNDPSALTPGHFLIGSALTSIPEVDYTESRVNRLSNWQHIQKVKQDFWTRWSKEYIHLLNTRSKWAKGEHTIQQGTLVILKDDHLPPTQWNLGRVLEIHPGSDGIIRAVTIKTMNGTYKRNVKKLASLPIELEK